jgi:uncharacterized Zn finger protein
MSIEEKWGNDFKSEIKTSGKKLFAQEKVQIGTGSDTAIQAYVRVAPPSRVKLSSEDIAAVSFTADCSCPVAKKSQFCKHVWATLLCVEEKYPDFLSAKSVIEKPSFESKPSVDATPAQSARAESQKSYQEAAKARASEYRKVQYQKQKLHAKKSKLAKLGREPKVNYHSHPAEVETALVYFSENGFPMTEGPDEAILGEAKRKLSRVFHPDKGGTSEEIVELNRNCDLLVQFMRS